MSLLVLVNEFLSFDLHLSIPGRIIVFCWSFLRLEKGQLYKVNEFHNVVLGLVVERKRGLRRGVLNPFEIYSCVVR